MKNLLKLFLMIGTLGACHSAPDAIGNAGANFDNVLEIPPTQQPRLADNLELQEKEETNSTIEKQIIKNADIRIQVEDFKASEAKFNALIKAYDAYIISSSQNNSNYSLEGSINLKVKADSLESLLQNLSTIGIYTQFKNIYTQDVTEEYIDINARLNTKKEVEARFKELLKKANTIKDILEIENNLRVIREEIDATEGRLKYIRSQVAMSSINLNYYQIIQSYEQVQEIGFWPKFTDSIYLGWTLFLEFLVGLVSLWPFGIIISALTLLFIRWKRNRNNKVL